MSNSDRPLDLLLALALPLTSEPVLRPVMEKELLHHDILRIMHDAGYLTKLTFVGGTALRLCYDSPRYSENLDFTGGLAFSPALLDGLASTLRDSLHRKYALPVTVSEPTQDRTNTRTWKVRITTAPERNDLPSQHINLDIACTTSQTRKPYGLLNHYRLDLGSAHLLIPTQTLEEIYADKLVAIALRPKIKARDVWDLLWLRNFQPASQAHTMILQKLKEHDFDLITFLNTLSARAELIGSSIAFRELYTKELQRFLPQTLLSQVSGDRLTFSGEYIRNEANLLHSVLVKRR